MRKWRARASISDPTAWLSIVNALPKRLTSVASSWNALATANPDLYLYASLLEAESFIHNDPRIAVWAQAYERGVSALNTSAKGSRHGGPLTTRPG